MCNHQLRARSQTRYSANSPIIDAWGSFAQRFGRCDGSTTEDRPGRSPLSRGTGITSESKGVLARGTAFGTISAGGKDRRGPRTSLELLQPAAPTSPDRTLSSSEGILYGSILLRFSLYHFSRSVDKEGDYFSEVGSRKSELSFKRPRRTNSSLPLPLRS
jgi:hypothetical protein